jgi:predicted transcriptional regulator
MFGLNSAGIIEGNIFTDYSSPESIMKSLLLPNPEATSIIEVNAEKGLNITKDLNNIIVSAASEGIFNVSDFTLDIWKEVLLTIRNQAKSLRAG